MRTIEKTIAGCLSGGDLPAVKVSDSVAHAIEVMKSTRAAAVVVLGQGRPTGIFTERDLLYRVAADSLLSTTTRMEEVMTENPQTLGPDDCVTYAVNRMAVGGYTNIPVVDGEGRAVGLLGVRDVLAHLSEVFDDLSAPDEPDVDMVDWIDMGGG